MAPHAIDDFTVDNAYPTSAPDVDLKAKIVNKTVEVEAQPAPPVADNFMYDFAFNAPLPTSKVLGVEVPEDCDTQTAAEELVDHFSAALGSGDAEAFADLFYVTGMSHRNSTEHDQGD